VAAADLVLAIYNPASKTRTWQLTGPSDPAGTPQSGQLQLVVGRDVGGAAEDIWVTTLGDLAVDRVDIAVPGDRGVYDNACGYSG